MCGRRSDAVDMEVGQVGISRRRARTSSMRRVVRGGGEQLNRDRSPGALFSHSWVAAKRARVRSPVGSATAAHSSSNPPWPTGGLCRDFQGYTQRQACASVTAQLARPARLGRCHRRSQAGTAPQPLRVVGVAPAGCAIACCGGALAPAPRLPDPCAGLGRCYCSAWRFVAAPVVKAQACRLPGGAEAADCAVCGLCRG